MYLNPPISPMSPEMGLRTPIERAKPRDAFCPTRNINTFFKKRSMSASSPYNCNRGADQAPDSAFSERDISRWMAAGGASPSYSTRYISVVIGMSMP